MRVNTEGTRCDGFATGPGALFSDTRRYIVHLDLAAESVQPSNPAANRLRRVGLLQVPCAEVSKLDQAIVGTRVRAIEKAGPGAWLRCIVESETLGRWLGRRAALHGFFDLRSRGMHASWLGGGRMGRQELLDRVHALVAEVTRARFEGSAYAKLSRAHGYADGYMRALLDAGLVDRDALLHVVGAARRAVVESELSPPDHGESGVERAA